MRKTIISMMLTAVIPLSSVLMTAQPGLTEPNGCRGYSDNPCGTPRGTFCWVFLCTAPDRGYWINWP
jgi:hypothetical protein